MGKANRPLVIRIKPGESEKDAIARALAKPRNQNRDFKKLIVRVKVAQ